MWGLILTLSYKYTDMAKITYLLGAGASANTIPIVNQMRDRINKIKDWLKSINTGMNPQNSPKELNINFVILSEWVKDLEWLLNEAGLYYSIDTLARKYYLMYVQITLYSNILV